MSSFATPSMLAHTLYRAEFEHDACGNGFIAHLSGNPSHEIVALGLTAISRLAHRGALNADGKTGDGAGLLTQLPYRFFADYLSALGQPVPASGALGAGMLFMPRHDRGAFAAIQQAVEAALVHEGLSGLAWRQVPIDETALGAMAAASCPDIRQVLVARPDPMTQDAFERSLYLARRSMERAIADLGIEGFYVCSLSSRTIVYKGLLASPQLASFLPDLSHPAFESAIAVFHQRFSTNTFPAWERAQPLRLMCHNGEINTLQGNVSWFKAREADLASALWGDRLQDLSPVIGAQGSDSAMLDNVLELLVQSGRDPLHSLMMLVPEAWEHVPDLDPAWRDFYAYHAGVMEPWDGPAALCYSDGRWVGSVMDRNGLRPARYLRTDDGLVVSASEMGVIDIADERIAFKGMLGPGEMIAVDTASGRFYSNQAIKDEIARRKPYGQWLATRSELPAIGMASDTPPHGPLLQRQMAFGYTQEDLSVILRPMLLDGSEPIGAMGDDTPLSVLSNQPRLLFSFFKQRFAEVTNPPIDPLREEWVMSLSMRLGMRRNLLEEGPEHARLIHLRSPILQAAELTALGDLARSEGFGWAIVPTLAPIGREDLAEAIAALCHAAERVVDEGHQIVVLSDRAIDADHAPLPSLLAVSAVHHHLIRAGKRMRASLVVDAGEPREVHHFAALIGFGANAVCPYLACDSVCELAASERQSSHDLSNEKALRHYVKAIEKGLLKVMSKMGIATLDSYCNAQIFEAVGLDEELVARHFTGTPSRLGGIGLAELGAGMFQRHRAAFSAGAEVTKLQDPGLYKVRSGGEAHAFNPDWVKALHAAVSVPDVLTTHFETGYRQYKALVERRNSQPATKLRDLLHLKPQASIPLDDVEPVEEIVRRFSTGAMSLGSLSPEAHATLATAMNRLGAMSNSGEGGEDPARFGTEQNSRIKQVASARFGVTPAYLLSADELQIKMAQGSKPGEGGQLPGRKVTVEIARLRGATPGTPLISPPPHHDIYSIEDLAQLIFDLKQVNSRAAISVKLVAQAGVGTIAAGVAKAHADVILISGHAGGTGASPLGSIKHAGLPWELGLAETQQTLIGNGLRGRVRLRVDGGLQTARDVLLAAMLGADEFSFGTAALVAEGCKMVRVCHNNSCPVGIATQRPELRAKFVSAPERVMAYMRFVAEEVRELLAQLGYRRLSDVVGRTDLLEPASDTPLDLNPLLAVPSVPPDWPKSYAGECNSIPTEPTLAERLLQDIRASRLSSERYRIRNTDRTIGARLIEELSRMDEAKEAIALEFEGTAGQSFGAFCPQGLHLTLVGDANDYVGKGLNGAKIAIRPPEGSRRPAHETQLVGNTVLYGATAGSLFVAGRAGGRFAVRNSGADAVVEGIGDHGCEYMTGGTIVVLGEVGRNFGAGMTGGVAYVLDEHGRLPARCNLQLVDCAALGPEDEAILQALLQHHLEATDSPRARALLDDWGRSCADFVRVSPREEAIAPPLPTAIAKPSALGEDSIPA